MNRIAAALLCIAIILCGCTDEAEPVDGTQSTGVSVVTFETEATTSGVTTTAPTTVTEPTTTTPEVQIPHYSDIPVSSFETEPQEFEQLYEAEDGTVSGSTVKSDEREGYSGSGYVGGIFTGGSLVITVELPTTQHYNITVRAASDVPSSGSLAIDGAVYGQFEISGSGEFESMRFDNVRLGEGEVLLSFTDFSAEIDIDCLLIENSESVEALNYELDGSLCNSAASENAQKLYSFILENYGEKTLSGQQCSQGTNAEIDAIYETTGRYPAIRFGELMDYSVGGDSGDIELAIEWAQSGGIVGYVWNWPINGSVYKNISGFDLTKAVTDLDIAAMEAGVLTQKYSSGDIAPQTLAVVDGIDKIAIQLLRLKEAGVPVIFRPLPEAGSGIFWWSADAESYLWLYKLIYERMTVYWQLDNLIWVWNGQSEDYYVGDEMTDIVSLDVYYPDGSVPGSCVNFLIAASKVSGKKPIALSECSSLPSPDSMAADNAHWSFAATWYGDYSPGGTYMQTGEWVQFYNSEIVLTKDEIEYNQ